MWEGEAPAGQRGESSDSEWLGGGLAFPECSAGISFQLRVGRLGFIRGCAARPLVNDLRKGSKDGRMPEVLRGRLPDGFAQSA
jgi:hypothetical protein